MFWNKVLVPLLVALAFCTKKRHHAMTNELLAKRPLVENFYHGATEAVQHELQILEEKATANFGNCDATHLLHQHLQHCANEKSEIFRFLLYNLKADPYFIINSKSSMELAIERGLYFMVHPFLHLRSRSAVIANPECIQKAAERRYWRVLEILSDNRCIPISKSYKDPLSFTGHLFSLRSFNSGFSEKILAAITEIVNHQLFHLFHWLFNHRIGTRDMYVTWLRHAVEDCVAARSFDGLRELHLASQNHRHHQTTAFFFAISNAALACDLELFEFVNRLCDFPRSSWISHGGNLLRKHLPNAELWAFTRRVLTPVELEDIVFHMINNNRCARLQNAYSTILSWEFPNQYQFNRILTRAMSKAIMNKDSKAATAIIKAISHHELSFRISKVRKFIAMAHEDHSYSVTNALLTLPLSDHDIRLLMPDYIEFALNNIFDQRCIIIAFAHLSTLDLLELHTKAARRRNPYWKTCSRLLKYRQSTLTADQLAQVQANKLTYNPLIGMTRVLESLTKLPQMSVYQAALLEQMTVVPSSTIFHEDCPICLLPMNPSNPTKPVVSLNHDPRHKFHARCILTHFVIRDSKCPICRHHIKRHSHSQDQLQPGVLYILDHA